MCAAGGLARCGAPTASGVRHARVTARPAASAAAPRPCGARDARVGLPPAGVLRSGLPPDGHGVGGLWGRWAGAADRAGRAMAPRRRRAVCIARALAGARGGCLLHGLWGLYSTCRAAAAARAFLYVLMVYSLAGAATAVPRVVSAATPTATAGAVARPFTFFLSSLPAGITSTGLHSSIFIAAEDASSSCAGASTHRRLFFSDFLLSRVFEHRLAPLIFTAAEDARCPSHRERTEGGHAREDELRVVGRAPALAVSSRAVSSVVSAVGGARVGHRSRRLRRISGDESDAQRQVDAELYGVGDPSVDASPQNLRHGL